MSRVCRCLSRKKVTPSLEDGFSPVGIPAEAQPRSAFEAKVPEETEPCPGCGTIYTPNANYCAHCGRRRGDAPKESSPSPVSEVKQSASPLPTSSPARENLPAKAPAPAAAPAPADNESTSRQATLPTAKAEAAPISTPKPSTPSVPSEPSAIPAGKEGNYVVELRREKPTDRYGFAWDANSLEKQNLRVINKILPGTLAAVWNASAPPGCDIRSGDMLVKVNGREGRLELMTVELSKQHVVCEFQPKEARVFGGAVKDVALPEASSAVTPSVPKVPPAKSAMEQPQVALPEASSAVTPSVPKVPPAKSAMEQPQVALPEASSAVTPSVPKVPPAKSAMEQPQVALPEASSAVTPFVPKVPPAKSAMEQPQVALPEASSAVTPSVPKAPPKSTMEQPKVTVQILEDSDSSSSSELEDKTPPSASTAQASHVAQPVTSSSSCLTVGTERPPELDHPSLEVVDQADVPTKAHREEVRAKAASLQKPEVETERTERECIVDLERGAVSEKWGFQWDREAMDRQQQRVISAVAPNSLAEDWNRRFPGRAVRKGYRLVKVNGVEDYGGIAAELKKKQITCHFEAGH